MALVFGVFDGVVLTSGTKFSFAFDIIIFNKTSVLLSGCGLCSRLLLDVGDAAAEDAAESGDDDSGDDDPA